MDLQLGLFAEEQLPPAAAAIGPAPVDARAAALASALPPGLRLGTSSWSFPGWAGLVYDRRASESVLAKEGLAAYAAHPLHRTVGLDRTFYRPISTEAFRAYADAVPDDFRFVVKADRLLTSPLTPGDRSMRGLNPLFLDSAHATLEVVTPMIEGLGSKAGPLLFQFPPIPANLVGGRRAFVERLDRFLRALPDGPVYAIELRTPAFICDEYLRTLEETGAVHCFNVHPAMTDLDRQLHAIQPFSQGVLVARWMLHAGLEYQVAKDRYAPFDRIVDEDLATRERLAVAVLDAALAERPAFVIANNKAEGSAPLTIARLAERGVDVGAAESGGADDRGA